MKTGSVLAPSAVIGFPLMIGYIGVLLMIIGGIVLLPLYTLLFYPAEALEARYFILPGILSIMTGYLLFYNIRGKEKGQLKRNQDAVIVELLDTGNRHLCLASYAQWKVQFHTGSFRDDECMEYYRTECR